MARLAGAFGWSPAQIAALPLPRAEALLAMAAQQRRADAADRALAVYAGCAAALAGPAGYRALMRWVAAQGGEGDGDPLLAEAGIEQW